MQGGLNPKKHEEKVDERSFCMIPTYIFAGNIIAGTGISTWPGMFSTCAGNIIAGKKVSGILERIVWTAVNST